MQPSPESSAAGRLRAVSGFTCHLPKDGTVRISHRHRHVVTLAGERARSFREQIAAATDAEAQLLMARVTGNFKRGNERRR